MKMNKLIFSLLCFFAFIQLNAQTLNLPLSNEFNLKTEFSSSKNFTNFHSNVKPFVAQDLQFTADSISLSDTLQSSKKWISSKNFIHLSSGNFALNINPVLHFDFLSAKTSSSSAFAGIYADVTIGKKIAANFTAFGGNLIAPNYLDSIITLSKAVPSIGYATKFGKNNYASSNLSGYVSYTPTKYFNFQLGNGKNFFGDGYRSMLLSDNAYNYPYFKITTNIWKFKYINLYTKMDDIGLSTKINSGYQKKYSSIHYLSWNVTKRFNFSIFETIVWDSRDTLGGNGFDVNYLNPVIFFRPIEYSVGSPDNAILGASSRFKLSKKIWLYGQIAIDEFYLKYIRAKEGWWANKQSFQLGAKWFDALWIKNLYGQIEYNYARPYTYSHGLPLQNYAHFGQPLAHPYGANFKEVVALGSYQYKNWIPELKIVTSSIGLDTGSVNYGQNVYKSYVFRPADNGNFVGQGLNTKLLFTEFKLNYQINSAYLLRVFAGVQFRSQSNNIASTKETWLIFGLKTALFNLYRDY
ncbi:MAG: hypothetical protein V4667_02100 [Bacteroidota bacterium]